MELEIGNSTVIETSRQQTIPIDINYRVLQGASLSQLYIILQELQKLKKFKTKHLD